MSCPAKYIAMVRIDSTPRSACTPDRSHSSARSDRSRKRFACLKTRRPWLAGALLALAAAIKAFPIAAIVYLLWRRQWKAAASTLVCLAVLLLVVPAAFRGFRGNLDDVRNWTRGMLLSNDAAGIGQRPDRSYSWQNQSLLGVTHRWYHAPA